MYWQWLSAPPAVILGVVWIMSSPLFQQQRDVTDELERVVSLLVPIVAALLSPLVAAIVLLFRQLVSEMRANREMSERLGRVVHANTTSTEAGTRAAEHLVEMIITNRARIEQLEREREARDVASRELDRRKSPS